MAAGAQSAIWRDGAEPTTTVGTEDIIEFNEGAVVNKEGNMMNTSFNVRAGIAVNERPGEIDKLQDTGLAGITITITGTIADPEGAGVLAAHKFKEWGIEAKTVDATFPKGRFGLRLGDFSVFNLVPSTLRGYMLQDVEFRRDGDTKGKLIFIATLRFNGTVGSPNGAGQYQW